MREKIVVRTNDPDKPNLKIEVFGNVEKFVTIRPGVVLLTGHVGKQVKAVVRIIPEKKYPFEIVGTSLIRGKYVGCELKEADASGGGGYVLTVENLRNRRGRYSDLITLKTTSKIRPEIKIKVYGNIFSNEPRKVKP
ncbi:MAG: hypothetical protein JRH09_06145 [Deltaproteobacteria bacterium]|nr:hypothetical protein [Deltaproteobacteria bacterium]